MIPLLKKYNQTLFRIYFKTASYIYLPIIFSTFGKFSFYSSVGTTDDEYRDLEEEPILIDS
ncbi:MAG: hypothetical protein U5N85_21480 [Arcicella sp.]|nr:hypothetical protein [Arcicella sp.]